MKNQMIGIVTGILFVLILPIFWFVHLMLEEQGQVHAEAGIMDLSSWQFDKDGLVSLGGEWEFYRGQLLEPADFEDGVKPENPVKAQIPGAWNDYLSENGEEAATGYGTFRLRIRLPDTETGTDLYGIHTTNIRMANRIFINSREVGNSGDPGALNRKGGQGNIPYVGFAEVEGNMADILVQVSNYSYATGGMIYPILFGDQTAIVVSREWKMTADLAAAVGMSILALYFLVIYRARRGEEQGLLFIGAFCVSALVYVLTHGEKLVANLLPGLSYELVMKLQATSPVIAYYCLFRYGLAFGTGKFHARFYLAINILMGVLLLINLVIPIGLFAVGSVMMTAFSQIVLLYGIYHLIQGIRHRREDAHYILLSMASILVLVSVSCLNVLGLLDDQVFVPYEMLMFIILQAFLMARRFEKTFIEVRQLSRRLLTIDGLRDEFLANTSHELRTPLHGIINMADSLLEGAGGVLSSKQSRDLATIAATGRSLSFLINDILDFAKLKNGEVILYRQEVDLPSVVQSVLEVIAHLAGVKDVRFIQDWPENLMLLDTDEERLRQILYNLLGNAVKYTPRGEIRISARAQGAYVRVEVADTGAGIPKERLEDIFQAYDQGSHAGSREYGGTGLGLSITKRLVELGGGQIGVESDSGQGAVFHFTLPAASRTRSSLMAGDARQEAAASLSPDLESDAALPAPAMSKVKEPANNKGTILVVDDNPVNLQVLENLLSITGYKVITAYDGEEALAVIAATPHLDLVITDWIMPGMSGIELCRAIRIRCSLFELPVLMLTARSRAEDVQAGFQAGANDFLSKPVEAGELRARVGTLLKLRKSVQQAIRTEMAFLQAQIKPHFLYNALNTTIAVCPDDPEKAMQLLIELSRYLRGSFDFQNREQLAPLHKELELIQSYLYLEKARFEERLQVEYDIDEQSRTLVPPLSIQPIVENAVRHGIMQQADGGTIRIAIQETEHALKVSVTDDGVGIAPDRLGSLLMESKKGGVGLINIHSRLLTLYGKGLRIDSEWGRGTTVSFEVPKP